jgi:hypothetical protein
MAQFPYQYAILELRIEKNEKSWRARRQARSFYFASA